VYVCLQPPSVYAAAVLFCVFRCVCASWCVKNASLPEYLALLRQAKNGRLHDVLGQTDACLRQGWGWQVSVMFHLMGVRLGPPSLYGAAVLFFVCFLCMCVSRCVRSASLPEYLALLRRMAGCRRCWVRRTRACGSLLRSWEWQVSLVFDLMSVCMPATTINVWCCSASFVYFFVYFIV
jgi:hypothetical protein